MAKKRPVTPVKISFQEETKKSTSITLSRDGLLDLLRKAGLPIPTDIYVDVMATDREDADPDPYLTIEWNEIVRGPVIETGSEDATPEATETA